MSYHLIPESDRPEMVANRRVTQAMSLLDFVLDGLDTTGFTMRDVQEGVNWSDPERDHVLYGQSHLNTLVQLGVLLELPGGLYQVDCSSQVLRLRERGYSSGWSFQEDLYSSGPLREEED